MGTRKEWRGVMLALTLCIFLGGCASLKDHMKAFGDKMMAFDAWFKEHVW